MSLLENTIESFKTVILFGTLLKSKACWTTVHSNVNKMAGCGTQALGQSVYKQMASTDRAGFIVEFHS